MSETINLSGKEIGLYSLAHLSFDNPYASEERKKLLIEGIDEILVSQKDTEWGKSFLKIFEIAKELTSGSKEEVEGWEAKVKLLIYEGNMFGLGASWGVSKEAMLLWAAVSSFLRNSSIDITYDKGKGFIFA